MRLKYSLLAIAIGLVFFANAQSVKGKLSLNGKSETTLKLETNSVVQLFKEFKTGKYKLQFSFDGDDLPTNIYNEKIVFFEFITTIKKDGELVKSITRKQPIPYFPGDMGIPAEAFDFVGLLAEDPQEEEELNMIGTMPEGNYQIELAIKPIGLKGEIKPLTINFILRKRPGRSKY
ncbi:MAG: hypothetical protein CMO82_00345 [Winogradskyella sp.]|nr:hypothetical protein [Winogradskyella sp.]|tara:strand:+ start:8151 stop:8678 length:528 start_codon:yes stop_codon:yes gene_type:complete